MLLVGLAIGAALGGWIGWLAAWRRASGRPPDTRLENELRQQVGQREAEIEELRQRLVEGKSAQATSEARLLAAEQLRDEQRRLHETALHDLRTSFRTLSSDALKETHPEFIRLANETLAKFQESAKGDLAQRQQAIATLVRPLEEQLRSYQQHLRQTEVSQSSALGEVRRQLEMLTGQSQSLSQETLQLRRVLSSSQARGRWGEETLRRVVEAAGLSPHCDFVEQKQSGDAKPDLIVHLPGERMILIDAKVPELDFLEAMDASNPLKRAAELATHAAKLRGTIKALAEKDYPRQFPQALDHVVLFLPAESLLSAAMEGDRELLVWATQRRIMLATPSTLIALLRAVSISWQQQAQSENARAISEAAQELYSRVCRFSEHFERIRSGLEKASSAFNEAAGSYERMVRPSGEKLVRLGGGAAGKELSELPPLELGLRELPLENSSLTGPASRP